MYWWYTLNEIKRDVFSFVSLVILNAPIFQSLNTDSWMLKSQVVCFGFVLFFEFSFLFLFLFFFCNPLSTSPCCCNEFSIHKFSCVTLIDFTSLLYSSSVRRQKSRQKSFKWYICASEARFKAQLNVIIGTASS